MKPVLPDYYPTTNKRSSHKCDIAIRNTAMRGCSMLPAAAWWLTEMCDKRTEHKAESVEIYSTYTLCTQSLRKLNLMKGVLTAVLLLALCDLSKRRQQ
jgi:hypothetical protein